jgi:hypothetical protein
MKTLDRGRLTVSADCLGAAEELLDRTIAYAKERSTFGLPLAARGEIRSRLAESWIDLFCIESALYEFAEQADSGEDIRDATARLKLFASETAFRVADQAMQIHGGFGYTVEGEIERFLRDLRVLRIAEGASEVMRATIAKGIHRALSGPAPDSAISLTSEKSQSMDATTLLLVASAGNLRLQAECDLSDHRTLAEIRDARMGDQAARWTMIDSGVRRSAGESNPALTAKLGLYVAARRLATDTWEDARLAASTAGTPAPEPMDIDLESLERDLGTTDQILDRVADELLGNKPE